MPQVRRSPLVSQILRYLLLISVALITVGPLLWLLSTALKSADENIFRYPPQLLPASPTLSHFGRIWRDNPFGRYFFNSGLVAGLTVVLNTLFCSLAAYPLARLRFRGRTVLFWAIVGTSVVPFQIAMIPLYLLAVQWGLRNSYLGLMLPYVVTPFGIFLLRQAFLTVPRELEEAAQLDGCSPLGIWWHIMLPVSRPALVTLGLFTFVGMWGDFLWPLVILDDPQYFTLPLGIANLASAFAADWRAIAAGSLVAIAPVVALFAWGQRYILPSEAGSGIRG